MKARGGEEGAHAACSDYLELAVCPKSMSPDQKHPKPLLCPASLGAPAKLTVHTIILAKRLASRRAVSTLIQASLPTSTERAKPKRLRPILGGSARPVDLKYWPATQRRRLLHISPFEGRGGYKISKTAGTFVCPWSIGPKGIGKHLGLSCLLWVPHWHLVRVCFRLRASSSGMPPQKRQA